jgi:hypothetical protein
MIGKVDMVEFLLDRGENQQALRYSAPNAAAKHGRLAVIEWLLGRGRFDPNIPTLEFPHGSLFAALHSRNRKMPRAPITGAMLEYGMYSNGIYPGVDKTALRKALLESDIKNRNVTG